MCAEHFFDWWRARVEFTTSLDPQTNFYEANLLVWANLDALANLWAASMSPPLRKSDRRRLGAFLSRHGDPVFARVSLPALWASADKLDATVVPEGVRTRLASYGGSEPTFLEQRRMRMVSDDPHVDVVLSDLADALSEPIDPPSQKKRRRTVADLVRAATLGEIAYAELRCAIVHEARLGERAHGFDFGDDAPSYLSGPFTVPPTIGFAVPFMRRVLRNCIDGLERESRERGISPVPANRG